MHREFPESQGLTPRHKETWAGMFDRLSEERSRRLDLFIRKSATKLRAEEESKSPSTSPLSRNRPLTVMACLMASQHLGRSGPNALKGLREKPGRRLCFRFA